LHRINIGQKESTKKLGQSVELAFKVETPDEVDTTYTKIIHKGATPIKSPEDKPWGQRAAFFADPDGNIHEIFADLPK
jgi:lactoylglutathione lyase